MLKINNLSKNFKDNGHHEVLRDISLSINDGEFVCILGPSGCGKSVFLYILAGFLQANSGSILLDGETLNKPSKDRILIFQDHILFPWLTVFENVMFGLQKTERPASEKIEATNQILNDVGLFKFKDWYPRALSGGMRQRIAIARALISDPKILLMDEPFSALDSQYRKYMRQSLEEIWQKNKKTIVFVTHSINESIYLADTIYLFSALPAQIKKTYKIGLPRPRNSYQPEFIDIAKDIENAINEEFVKLRDEAITSDFYLKKEIKDTKLI